MIHIVHAPFKLLHPQRIVLSNCTEDTKMTLNYAPKEKLGTIKHRKLS